MILYCSSFLDLGIFDHIKISHVLTEFTKKTDSNRDGKYNSGGIRITLKDFLDDAKVH
jgi:hypothetical protein